MCSWTGVPGQREEHTPRMILKGREGVGRKAGTLPVTSRYLPMGDQQLLNGLALADRGIKDGLHVQLLQVLMLLVPPAPEGVMCIWVHMWALGGWGLNPIEA